MKYLICVICLFCIGLVKAQNLSIIDCATVLVISEDSTSVVDTLVDITMDDLMTDVSEFEIIFIVEVEDSSLVDQVHINIGKSIGDSNVLSQSYSVNSNISTINLVYDTYANFINIKVGEYTVDSLLHYSIELEDSLGHHTIPFSGNIER